MQRTVTCSIDLGLTGPVRLIYSVAVAQGLPLASETISITIDGASVEPMEIVDAHGTRLHSVDANGPQASLSYEAVVDGIDVEPPVTDTDDIVYLRPSRYCESDSLGPTAHAEFAGLTGYDLLSAVSSWVGSRLSYVPGSSLPTDGAVRTLLARQGVCRDYAHLVVALLRALDVPARLVSVYAPGLTPMDFHAVAEVALDGIWEVVDATERAPRPSMLRLATGRDAADTAFLTTHQGQVRFGSVTVTAYVDPGLPADDNRSPLSLG